MDVFSLDLDELFGMYHAHGKKGIITRDYNLPDRMYIICETEWLTEFNVKNEFMS